jgi:uncharacterized protein (TIGR00730 family)
MRWCVFCGSNTGDDPAFAREARSLGQAFAERGVGLVYGGGSVGLMGEISRTVMEHGGEAIGIIPRALADREIASEDISELHVVEAMHDRKAMMAKLSSGFIALPGGYGTFEEFCEMVTWVQLALHDKPCLLLNINGYYDPLIAMFDNALRSGLLTAESREIVHAYTSVEALVEHLDDELAAAAAS